MPGWYDIFALDPSAKEDEAGLYNSVGIISSIIAEEINAGISPEKIILAGFSQGAALSTLYAISTNVKLVMSAL